MLVPKYKLNQELWAVSSTYNTHIKHVECELCNSTGKVEINGEKYKCPKCDGKMKTIQDGFKYIVSTHGKVGRIDTEEYAKRYKNKSSIKYMLDSTGVESGILWYESRLFPTEKAAKKFCDTHTLVDYYDSEKENINSN